MNLYLRLLLVVLRAWAGRSLDPLATARTPFRVWPHDLDVNLHMNNGRYATLMDLGRVDLMARAGMLGAVRREGLMPVVTGQHLTYRRALPPFARFEIATRVAGWDERNVYLEQVFTRGGEVAMRGLVQTLFLKGGKRLPSAELVVLFGMEGDRPVPEDVAALFPHPARRQPVAA